MAKKQKSQLLNDDIREAMRRYRADNSLTQKDFGALVGVDQKTVMRWETGDANTIRGMSWVKVRDLIEPFLRGKPSEEKTIMPTEIKSVPSETNSTPVVNVQLTAKELAMLEEFRNVPQDMKTDAITLIEKWRQLDRSTQVEVVDCTRAGRTCLSGSNVMGEARRGIAPLPSSASTVKIPHH